MSDPKKKIAVVLFNLGGPDKKESIRPFLINFFMDKNIIRAPVFVRWPLSRFIAWRRTNKEAGKSYGELGDKSPLLENSSAQATALEKLLNLEDFATFKTYICMRYWHPMAGEIAAQVKEYNPDEIVLLPLYPQFSTTTTKSSLQQWRLACEANQLSKPTTTICCYPWEDGFIEASADNIRPIYDRALEEAGKAPRLLLSAHGLPESIVKDGDPYQWQCEQSAQKIAEALKIDNLDWQICYQSRVGPQKWIGPSTEEALHQAAKDGVPVVILPHAFTQEHVETLVEIEIEYREIAEELGVKGFYRVPTVGMAAPFLQGLADLVVENVGEGRVLSHIGKSLCPNTCGDCAMRTLNRQKESLAA